MSKFTEFFKVDEKWGKGKWALLVVALLIAGFGIAKAIQWAFSQGF